MSERGPNPETKIDPKPRRPVDPELAKKLGRVAVSDQVEHPDRTAKVERVAPDGGRVAVRGAQRSADRTAKAERVAQDGGRIAVREAQRSERPERTSGPDRPAAPETRERG